MRTNLTLTCIWQRGYLSAVTNWEILMSITQLSITLLEPGIFFQRYAFFTIKMHFYLIFSFALEETPKTADENEADDLKFKCATNLVGCHLQLSNFPHVVSLASDILSNKNSPKNVKLLYRRGIANLVRLYYKDLLLCSGRRN